MTTETQEQDQRAAQGDLITEVEQAVGSTMKWSKPETLTDDFLPAEHRSNPLISQMAKITLEQVRLLRAHFRNRLFEPLGVHIRAGRRGGNLRVEVVTEKDVV